MKQRVNRYRYAPPPKKKSRESYYAKKNRKVKQLNGKEIKVKKYKRDSERRELTHYDKREKKKNKHTPKLSLTTHYQTPPLHKKKKKKAINIPTKRKKKRQKQHSIQM